MSHYDAQLEQIEAERAARRFQTEALHTAALNRAIDGAASAATCAVATAAQMRTLDILAAMTAAVERVAIAAERIAAIQMDAVPLDMPGDGPDAPHPTPAQTFTEAHRRELIRDLHDLCWPQCAMSRNPGDGTVSVRIPNTAMALDHIAQALGDIGIDCLCAILASFPCHAQDATRIAIAFPASWALSA